MPPDPPRIEGGPSIITAAYFSRVGRLLQNILKPLTKSDLGPKRENSILVIVKRKLILKY